MDREVVGLEQLDRGCVAIAGGKAAHLGELGRIDGVRVPAGFCVTTAVFRRAIADAPGVDDGLERLTRLAADDAAAIRACSAQLRGAVERIAVPDDAAAVITGRLAGLGADAAYAVRSSATAEDLPSASFAGQHDTYLNVAGPSAILRHVRRCWASLFTERAVTYRLRAGVDHRSVEMAVVVQRMVAARAAGTLFTADPTTSNRKVASVEAVLGLGEDLVSGSVNADAYTVRDGEVVGRAVSAGTDRSAQPVLTDAQIVRLVRLGRRIEAHLGHPQDIEWCLAGDEFQIVQTRPITTLFPVPEAADGANHVYVSVGHGQMMTDAMKPLGISLWQLTTPRPMLEAGGRLFVDVTQELASPARRAALLEVMGRGDPLIGDALRTIVDRGDLVPEIPDAPPAAGPAARPPAPAETDPSVVPELIGQSEASVAALRREIRTRSGPELLDFIFADIGDLRRILFDPRSHRAIMAGMEAAWWLNDRLQAWLGETNAADALTRSVAHNVTSEMGLALLDVADAIRPHPAVVSFLERVEDDGFLDALAQLSGGPRAQAALRGWLERYGMRGVGEIDVTRPRFRERPAMLVPLILEHVRTFEPGEAGRRFERGRRAALEKRAELLERLRAQPDGDRKAAEAERMIDRVRAFAGYREYPKYGMISRYFEYKRALLGEGERLAQRGVLRGREDIFWLTLEELRDVVRTNRADEDLIRRRAEAFRSYEALTPPRVLTSEGEVVAGAYRRDELPAGALVGLAVSGGTVEGRARVVLDLAGADLDAGDILVTAYTDPSWTPAFVAIAGLVTEVGGLMTHGAVIAREYGLPAVVGVEHATRLIRDGQRIRVHGTDGYVEVVPAGERSAQSLEMPTIT